MLNLYQIVTGAQGGQALDNLAARFGLTREQTDSAVRAFMPALSTAFMTKAMHPGGMQEIAAAMADEHHRQAYADPGLAAAPQTQAKGDGIATSIFGNAAMIDTVVREASRLTGVSETTLRRMLPIVVSILIGGVATALHNQGLSMWLGQLANNPLGKMFAPPTGAGGLGAIFGGLFGGAPSRESTAPQPGASQTSSHGATFGGLPPAMQTGMEAFGKMFQPGVQGQFGPMGAFGEQIASILSGKRS